MAYDNELRGVLFKNKDKEEGDKKPDYTGSATIEGNEYFMDAWINPAKSGRKYMSVKFKLKTKQAAAPQGEPAAKPSSRQQTGTGFDGMDDDIPW